MIKSTNLSSKSRVMKRLSLFLLIIFTACKATEIHSDKNVVIFMKKTDCMGECPVYEMSIFTDGYVTLHAKKYLPIEGLFEAKLTDSALEELMAAFDDVDFFGFKKSYTSNMTDLPTTTLRYNKGAQTHTVVDYDGAPQSLKALERRVHSLIEELDWQSIQ